MLSTSASTSVIVDVIAHKKLDTEHTHSFEQLPLEALYAPSKLNFPFSHPSWSGKSCYTAVGHCCVVLVSHANGRIRIHVIVEVRVHVQLMQMCWCQCPSTWSSVDMVLQTWTWGSEDTILHCRLLDTSTVHMDLQLGWAWTVRHVLSHEPSLSSRRQCQLRLRHTCKVSVCTCAG